MPTGRYFQKLNTIIYPDFGEVSGESKIVIDIFKRVRATIKAQTDATAYYTWTINEGQTPEDLSYNYYGTPQYHWVILLMNNIRDPQWQWPLKAKTFDRYIVKKYGSVEYAQRTHSHYESVKISATQTGWGYDIGDILVDPGYVVNEDFSFTYGGGIFTSLNARKALTLYDKEFDDNEKRRNIILLRRNLIGTVIKNFESLVTKKS